MPTFYCERQIWGCKYFVTNRGKGRILEHEKNCKILSRLSKPYFKLLLIHHELSCDIKWLSLAHDFGRSINFKYVISYTDFSTEPVIYMVFEDPSHLIDHDHQKGYDVSSRLYGLKHMFPRKKLEYLLPYRWHCTKARHDYIDCGIQIPMTMYGSINDICGPNIRIAEKTSIYRSELKYMENSSLESIAERKIELKGIRKKIDNIIVPFLNEQFPKVLATLIIDYCL